MKRHGYLFERIVAWENLLLAAKKAARGKAARPDVARFLFHLEGELLGLERELGAGDWRPGPARTFAIRDPKPRRITAAPFRDRVVHHAIMNVLDPIFEACLIDRTYACRRGKGVHRAVRQAQRLARRFPFLLQGDVEACFESIDHQVLKALLRRKLKDERLLALLDRIVGVEDTDATPGVGLPIGNLTSQYFANHYLGQLDHFVKEGLRVRGYLRYMDDFLLFGAGKAELHRYRAAIRSFLATELCLELKEAASAVRPTQSGFTFLGLRVFPRVLRVERHRLERTRRKIRRREKEHWRGVIAEDALARSVGSAVAHLSRADTHGWRRSLFHGLSR